MTNQAGYDVWPEFILDLLNHPRDWAAWRKRTERGLAATAATTSASLSSAATFMLMKAPVNSQPMAAVASRREAYFEALRRDRFEEIAGVVQMQLDSDEPCNEEE